MKFERYKQNLSYDGEYVISYNTKVAKREGDFLYVKRWYSCTTTKHINYAAKELGLKVMKLYE